MVRYTHAFRAWVALTTVVIVVSSAQADVINSGFELGDFTGWTATAWRDPAGCKVVYNPSAAPQGDHYAYQSAVGSTESISQIFTFSGGAETFSVDLSWSGVGFVDSSAAITLVGDTTTINIYSGAITGAGVWKTYTVDVSSMRGQQVELLFEVSAGPNDNMRQFIDNIIVTPEPSALLVLFAGAAVLPLHRRARRVR